MRRKRLRVDTFSHSDLQQLEDQVNWKLSTLDPHMVRAVTFRGRTWKHNERVYAEIVHIIEREEP